VRWFSPLATQLGKIAASLDGYTFSTREEKKRGMPLTHVIDVHDTGGKNVAYLTHRPADDGSHQAINAIFVAPEHRQRGLGSELMRRAIAANPDAELRLRARPFKDKPLDAESLKQFYGKQGFEKFDDENRMVIRRS